ncbi:hypothetical protein NA57DRAFT_73722 [Rhizodiscina lignyota]|uniref:Uncharacterized protein n=1 Tax=Rhizodiscina lignyota TaxID=1504668 RepID=A0A9P4IN49_9PEZI|nr:hypothetical protein NA57DRAFT_73722 [Rhizodiscina lignyota]
MRNDCIAKLNLAITLALVSISFATATPHILYPRKGKPTGGPAFANLTVFTGGSFSCSSKSDKILNDGSAGTATSVSITEEGCSELPINDQNLIQVEMTALPRSNSEGCYLQLFTQDGCGFILSQDFWGTAIPGIDPGSTLGCTQVPAGFTFGGAALNCG